MKKNVMMRVASALLVAVLLTTCTISGTFAKYTTEATGTDSARVAYWGFNQSATITIDLFDDAYDNTVAGAENVIAPGTSKTATFAFGSIYTANTTKSINAPEVDYKFTVTPTVTGTYTELDANPNFKWTLKAADDADATEYNTVADLLTAIKALGGATDGAKDYKAGTLPEIFTDATKAYTIGWEWKFEKTDGDDAAKATQDETDTAMGNAEALENIKFEITVTATQID